MDSIVALDIETTGVDSQKDAVIEIGAVRFKDHRVEGEWSTLVNPGCRIPPFVTQLTGITDQMVLRSPSLREVLSDLDAFVGDSPILGHNVRFDLSFLRRQKILKNNITLDTYEMASVLLPNAGRYNLGALANALGVPFPATHRALADARATRGVFLRLQEHAMEIPIQLLAEIIRLSDAVAQDWSGYWPFRSVMRDRSHELVSPSSIQHVFTGPLFSQAIAQPGVALAPSTDLKPLDLEETTALIEPGGAFARHFSQYEHRPQQVAMLQAVTRALSEQRHLMVEAGTGTGKSMAYLIPAALFAMQNNRRVVISTNTINLQDQLINKDIPDLRDSLGIDLRATVLKGRVNYLCPRRLENLRRRGPENADEMRVLGKILVWLRGTTTGDRAEINLNMPSERSVWSRLSAEDDMCTGENCLKYTGGACPFFQARQAAQNAHLLIVNHALLLSDVATGNRVLPEYDYLIIDEGHHLEDATTNALSYQATLGEIERTLTLLGGSSSGALGWLLSASQNILQPAEYASLAHLVESATDLAFRFQHQVREFYSSIERFLEDQRENHPMGMYAQQERIIEATRTQPAWGDVELSWDETQLTLKSLVDHIAKLSEGTVEIQEAFAEEDQGLYSALTNLYRRFDEFQTNVNAMIFEPTNEQIYWADLQPDSDRLALHAAPLHIGSLMERYLWHEKSSIILTSATLTTTGEFDFLRGRLNAQDADELALGSPFDFETATLLYLVNDIPEPSDQRGHQRAVETGLINLCRVTGGRTLVLFTSYDQLKRTSHAISSVLSSDDILIYEQGEGASPHSLLENFRLSERAILLGTRAFWEGVDIPGEALSVLVIAKLPFAVPSDPIVAARAETFEDPFYQYSLPEAILRFRQGFGRLIRTQSDRGLVAVFDRRVLTKKYGRFFIESLPQCTTRTGPMIDLPKVASKWLNL